MTWEGGQRVPMLARLPGRVAKGKVVDVPCGVWDLMPTVCSLTGAPKPNVTLDGVDLTGVLGGSARSLEREPMLVFDGLDLHCARWGKWKLHVARRNHVMYSPPPQGGPMTLPIRPELYDVASDVDESFDVAAENPEVVRQMMSKVDAVMAGMPEAVRKARAEVLERQATVPPAGQVPQMRRN